MNIKEARDVLANCIDDYVIGDFCTGKFCPMESECKDKECVFHESIETVLAELEKQRNKIPSLKNGTYTGDYEGLLKMEQEIIKRDKIIDLMAEEFILESKININSYKYINMDKESIKQYFERKVEK